MAGRWNYEKRLYEPYVIPDEWHCPLITYDMDEKVNCVSCGQVLTFGECFTSREIHTDHGMGYFICPSCHEQEIEKELKLRGKCP